MRFWPFRAAPFLRLASYLQSWVNAIRRQPAREINLPPTPADSQPAGAAAPPAAWRGGTLQRGGPPEHWLALLKNAQGRVGTNHPVQRPEPPDQTQGQPASPPPADMHPGAGKTVTSSAPTTRTARAPEDPVFPGQSAPGRTGQPGSFPRLPLEQRRVHASSAAERDRGTREAAQPHSTENTSTPGSGQNLPRIAIPVLRAPRPHAQGSSRFPALPGSESAPGAQASDLPHPTPVRASPSQPAENRRAAESGRDAAWPVSENGSYPPNAVFPDLPGAQSLPAAQVSHPSHPLPDHSLRLPGVREAVRSSRAVYPRLAAAPLKAVEPAAEISDSAPANTWPALPSTGVESPAQDPREMADRELRHIQKLEREQRGQLWNE